MMKNKIKELSASLKDQLVDSRRYLHQYPELAFEEFKTAAFIKSQLDDWGISYRDQVAKTGVVLASLLLPMYDYKFYDYMISTLYLI